MTTTFYLHDIKSTNVGINSAFPNKTYMDLFCHTREGQSVFIRVTDFKPFFYVDMNYEGSGKEQVEIVSRKKFIGFTDSELFQFKKLSLNSQPSLCVLRKKLRDTHIPMYEEKVDPVLRFLHSANIRPSAYFDVTYLSPVKESNKLTHCQFEFQTTMRSFAPHPHDLPPPPIVLCAYDIETSGLNSRDCKVFQISMCFSKMGESMDSEGHATENLDAKNSIVLCLYDTESIDGTTIWSCDSEEALLYKFRDVLIERNVSILMGYNNYQFDAQFLYKRASILGLEDYYNLSYIKDHRCELVEKQLESSALGKTELKQVIIPGRIEFDLYMTVRRQYKLPSNKLSAVSTHFFGSTKDDITFFDILEAYQTRDSQKLGVIAKYCLQDSWLVLRLAEKIKDVYDSVSMSKLCIVPLSYILSRGQQIKCLSLILNYIKNEYVCNTKSDSDPINDKDKDEEVGYQGACVLEAHKGFYSKDPIVTLDFQSLYPSIMRAKQLCYTTHVQDPKYLNLDGVTYEKYETFPGVFETFAHRKGQDSVISHIQLELGNQRKATKRDMKNVEDPFIYSLLDSKQKAQKITMNSIYGFTGTKTGMLPLVAIAAAVTCVGRDTLSNTQKYLEKEHGARIVYGDSVASYTPVYIRVEISGLWSVEVLTIESIAEKYGGSQWIAHHDTKESCEINNIQTWTEQGWTPLYRVIRHRLHPDKKMIRILTKTGLVDVTEDHSLLLQDGSEVRPVDVVVGVTKLLHSDLPHECVTMPEQRILPDSCLQQFLDDGYIEVQCQLHASYVCLVADSIYALSIDYVHTDAGTVYRIAMEDREKTDPELCPEPLESSDHQCVVLRKEVIRFLDDSPYVYDLTTANHHFAAGMGRLVVHNTDSVMAIFKVPESRKQDHLHYLFEKGAEVAELATSQFDKPIILEFENIYYPYLLISKKRYAGRSWTCPEGPPTLTVKGLVTVRRDNAPIVGKCAKNIINMIMDCRDSEIVQYVKETTRQIQDGAAPIEDVVIRKELKKWEYVSSTCHAEVAKKQALRYEQQMLYREIGVPYTEGKIQIDFNNLQNLYGNIQLLKLKVGGMDKNFFNSKPTAVVVPKTFVNSKKLLEFVIDKHSPGQDVEENTLVQVIKKSISENRFFRRLISNDIHNEDRLYDFIQTFKRYDVIEWSKPRLGDRIEYVITRGPCKDISDRAEDPRLYERGLVKLDTLYYINNQLKNPLVGLLEHVMDDPHSIFTDALRMEANKNKRVSEITTFFKPRKNTRI